MSRLKHNDMDLFLQVISKESIRVSVSYLINGRWETIEAVAQEISDKSISMMTIPGAVPIENCLTIDQPVGISVSDNEYKYMAESLVIGLDSKINDNKAGYLILMMPAHVQKLLRRAFVRVNTPADLTVKVLFWHRSYCQSGASVPAQTYWEGILNNLSAGGLQMTVPQHLADNFSRGQFIGLQFTPLPFQKPIVLEGTIRHIMTTLDGRVSLGIQFMGLESSEQGRETTIRLTETVQKYER